MLLLGHQGQKLCYECNGNRVSIIVSSTAIQQALRIGLMWSVAISRWSDVRSVGAGSVAEPLHFWEATYIIGLIWSRTAWL